MCASFKKGKPSKVKGLFSRKRGHADDGDEWGEQKENADERNVAASNAAFLDEARALSRRIKEKRELLSRVLEPVTYDNPGKIDENSKEKKPKQGKKKDADEHVVHQVDETTEEQTDVYIKKDNCIVCNKPVEGTSYICPGCGTKYCIRCAIALNERDEECWMCNRSLQF